jgi:hypothetical protein
MTLRRLIWVGAGVAFLLVALSVVDSLLAPTFGSAPNEHPELQAALVTEANRVGFGGTVTLSDVYNGDWDRAWIWDGYTADREHKVFPGVDFGDGGYGSDYVVAFGLDGKLVAWVRFNINEPHVFFDPPASGLVLSRKNAKLLVSEHPTLPGWYLLTPE